MLAEHFDDFVSVDPSMKPSLAGVLEFATPKLDSARRIFSIHSIHVAIEGKLDPPSCGVQHPGHHGLGFSLLEEWSSRACSFCQGLI